MKRSPTVKIDELEVRERVWPLIVAVSYDAVCHISTHNGILRARNERHKNPREEHYVITKCGRALRYTVGRTHLPVEQMDRCTRCGSQADFEAAHAEYHLKWEKRCQEDAERDAIEVAKRQLERDRQAAVLEALYQALAWDNVEGMSWNPVIAKTMRGQHVIYLELDTQLPGSICVGDGLNYAYPQLYRAVVHLERIPEDESETIPKYRGHQAPGN